MEGAGDYLGELSPSTLADIIRHHTVGLAGPNIVYTQGRRMLCQAAASWAPQLPQKLAPLAAGWPHLVQKLAPLGELGATTAAWTTAASTTPGSAWPEQILGDQGNCRGLCRLVLGQAQTQLFILCFVVVSGLRFRDSGQSVQLPISVQPSRRPARVPDTCSLQGLQASQQELKTLHALPPLYLPVAHPRAFRRIPRATRQVPGKLGRGALPQLEET